MNTDNDSTGLGWYLDDVRVYTCPGVPATPGAPGGTPEHARLRHPPPAPSAATAVKVAGGLGLGRGELAAAGDRLPARDGLLRLLGRYRYDGGRIRTHGDAQDAGAGQDARVHGHAGRAERVCA